jgi:hypothetical protein
VSDYLLRQVEVGTSRKARSGVLGDAVVDTAAPFTVVPLDWAREAGIPLGPISTTGLPVGALRPLFRTGRAVVRFTGRPAHEITVHVPESAWHRTFGGHVLLGTNFLQLAKARIDYRRKVRGRHPVTSNPPDPILQDYPVTPGALRIPGMTVLCPECGRSVRVVRGGRLKAHDFRYARCAGSGWKVLTDRRGRPGAVA